jgi:hypothetical protein
MKITKLDNLDGTTIDFTAKQGILLYEALVHSLPPGSVVLK